jgi:hypothetical protein
MKTNTDLPSKVTVVLEPKSYWFKRFSATTEKFQKPLIQILTGIQKPLIPILTGIQKPLIQILTGIQKPLIQILTGIQKPLIQILTGIQKPLGSQFLCVQISFIKFHWLLGTWILAAFEKKTFLIGQSVMYSIKLSEISKHFHRNSFKMKKYFRNCQVKNEE